VRLVSSVRGSEHKITIPRHQPLRVGTLAGVVREDAEYLEMDREVLIQALFGKGNREG